MSNQAVTLAGIRDWFRTKLREENFATNLLVKAETKTKVNREYIALDLKLETIKDELVKNPKLACVVGFIALYLVVGWGNDFLCNLIGFLYPAYASVKAIESSHSDDDTKWLMYWCVYAFFGILEFFSDQLLFWIPLYTLSKCMFLLWLMVPGSNGGTHVVYHKLIRPFVLKHQSSIDAAADKAKDKFNKISKELLSEKQQ
ncbi:unnamed protein product [Brachionus calyciflorus]|uniref:Receptor expression-enhancing protein n=1 Tax=Brachionus calyciflorus TaxID=104777 RepID=A0A814D6F6_9BILA|nr:unnamed protein product [Brachionus calyciflorus]